MSKPKHAVVIDFNGKLSIIETNKNINIKTKGTSLFKCKKIIEKINAR